MIHLHTAFTKYRVGILSGACLIGGVALLLWLAGAPKPWAVTAKDPDLHKMRSLIQFYSWWAGAINASLLFALAATARFWGRLGGDGPHEPWLPRVATPRWFWPLLALTVGITLLFGVQRIGQSLWGDEEDSVRTYIHGEWMPHSDGSLKFRKPGWEHTFFNHRRTTNHQFQSILSRISHELWVGIARPQGLGLSETALRVPGFLVGLTAAVVLGALLLRLGLPRAGVVAAWLLVIHPWFIRYVTEARGYIFVIVLIPLLLLVLLNAVERRSWGWWLAFGACGLLTLYSHASTLYVLLLTNLLALVAILLRNPHGERTTQVVRWLIVNVLAGMAYLQLMLPCLPQMLDYLASDTMRGILTTRWHENLGSHFFAGVPWNNSDNPSAGLLEMKWLVGTQPWHYGAAFAACGLLIPLGAWKLLRVKPAGWIVVAVFTLPAFFVYAMALMKGNYLYEWYLIPALPGVLATVGVGLDRVCAPLSHFHRAAPWLALGALLAAYGALSEPARAWLLARSIQPMRESVLAIRPTLDPFDPRQEEILTARLNAPPRSYDPRAVLIDKVEVLLTLMRHSDATGKPLYVNYGNIHAAAVDFPDISTLIEEDRLFEKFPKLPGLDPTLERYIRRYRPGSVEISASTDLSGRGSAPAL